MTDKKHTPSYTAEFRARGVRLFREHRSDYSSNSAAYRAIASKLGCSSFSLRDWCRRAARDAGELSGPTSEERARIKALERENRELRQANEILKKASAYFAAAELDLPFRGLPPSSGPLKMLVHGRPLVYRDNAFRRWWTVSQRAVRSDSIVVAAPSFDQNLSLPQRVEDLAVQQFVPESCVKALAVTVLPR